MHGVGQPLRSAARIARGCLPPRRPALQVGQQELAAAGRRRGKRASRELFTPPGAPGPRVATLSRGGGNSPGF